MMRYLENIVDFLQNTLVSFANENDDGRLNSATNENIILHKLADKFKEVQISSIRQTAIIYLFNVIGRKIENFQGVAKLKQSAIF